MRRAEQCCTHNKISDCAVLKLKCTGDAVLLGRTDKLKAGFAVSPCRSYSSEELWSFCRKVNSLKTDFGFCRLFTNCTFRDGKTFARIPRFKEVQVSIPEGAGKFCCAEVVPFYDSYRLILTFEVDKKAVKQKEPERIAGMDLGSRYLAALTSKDECLLIGGRKLRAQNNRIARRIARLMSLGTKGNPEADWTETRETQRLRKKRKHLADDYLHKASREIVNWLTRNKIDTLVIGHNKGWKVKPRMSRFFNKAFQPIPHSRLIQMVRYKAEEAGIRVLETEESYTSKACFLDRDVMPVWKPVKEGEKKEDYWFAGRRIKRSLYKDGNGNIIHADLNGAATLQEKSFRITVFR